MLPTTYNQSKVEKQLLPRTEDDADMIEQADEIRRQHFRFTDTLEKPKSASNTMNSEREMVLKRCDISFLCMVVVNLTAVLHYACRAFSRYDVDGDGVISVDDLRSALELQSKAHTSDEELIDWIYRRDSTGTGCVNFDDFAEHFQ